MTIIRFIIPAICLLFVINSCTQQPVPDKKMNSFISDLMTKMTLEEKLGQLTLLPGDSSTTGPKVSENVEKKIKVGGVGSIMNVSFNYSKKAQEIAVNESRLKIPILFAGDVIHGYTTMFPIPLGMSCTWDMGLIERFARIAEKEINAFRRAHKEARITQ